MRLTATLMATLACSQAISIEATVDSQANVEFFSDIGDWATGAVNDVGNSVQNAVNDIGYFVQDAVDGFIDGLD